MIHTGAMIRIGLISDTHGLLRPEAIVALTGVARIIHAGDIGSAQILEDLARIAPVSAVRGNNDRAAWAEAIPLIQVIEVGGVRIYVLHDVGDLAVEPHTAGLHVVVAGHSHRPSIRQEGETLFVNPGSAGPRRFKLPVALGFLDIDRGRVEAHIRVLG